MMVSLHMRRGIVDFVGLGFRTDRSSSDVVSPDSMFIVQVSITYWHALGSVTHGTSCPTSLHAHAPVPVPIFVNICMRVCYRVESAEAVSSPLSSAGQPMLTNHRQPHSVDHRQPQPWIM